jgi:hypothetical protein
MAHVRRFDHVGITVADLDVVTRCSVADTTPTQSHVDIRAIVPISVCHSARCDAADLHLKGVPNSAVTAVGLY